LLLVGVAVIQRRHRNRSRVLGWTAIALLAVGLLFGGQVARDHLILGMPLAVAGRRCSVSRSCGQECFPVCPAGCSPPGYP
jgi:hypothetical protein